MATIVITGFYSPWPALRTVVAEVEIGRPFDDRMQLDDDDGA